MNITMLVSKGTKAQQRTQDILMASESINTQNPDIHERFRVLLKALNHSGNSFARLIGVNPSQIVNVIGGRLNKPSMETLEKIGLAIPRLNMEWLVTGRGEMMKPYPGQSVGIGHTIIGNSNAIGGGISIQVDNLAECRKELEVWIQRARAFEALAADRQTIIDLLKQQNAK